MKNQFGIEITRPILVMALDALNAMPDSHALDAIMIRLDKMSAVRLEQFGHEIGRIAWDKYRIMNARSTTRAPEGGGVPLPASSPHRGETK